MWPASCPNRVTCFVLIKIMFPHRSAGSRRFDDIGRFRSLFEKNMNDNDETKLVTQQTTEMELFSLSCVRLPFRLQLAVSLWLMVGVGAVA